MKRILVIGSITVVGLVICITLFAMGEDSETEIPLSEVPQKAIEAAQKAVDGIELVEAEVEEENGVLVYDLVGKAGGIEYEIEVTSEGKVLEVEQEDDDGDDSDDDGDDSDDDEKD